MPLYEYECDACGHRFEIIRRFSDPPVKTCPSCGADSLRKLFAAPAIQFKGSGWYITDYAQKAAKSDAQAGGKEDGKKAEAGAADAGKAQASQADSGGKTETKPAAKTEKGSPGRDTASSSSPTGAGTSSSKNS